MAVRPPNRTLNLFCSAKQARLPRSGWRKVLDSALRKLGPSWHAAPARRALQTTCLLLYLDLFFRVCWPYAALFSSQVLSAKEWLPVEVFLWIDPLVGLSAAIAARCWNVAVIGMAIVLVIGLVFPRGFCGYLCPLGTLIDLFDFMVGKRIPWLNTQRIGRWANARFYLLAAVLVAALGGVLLSGFVAAIPVLTRGLLFSAGNVQLGLAKNWGLVPPITGAVWLSLALFVGVFCLSLLGPRFWCRHVCPSGALLSLPSWLRLSKRQTSNRCTACGNCIAVCPFDAIEPDFSTRMLNCTFCQTCGGICPTGAIRPLSLADKRRFVIGLAVVDTALCLPHRGERDCQFCLDECNAAGYRAIEMRPIKLATGSVPEGAFSPDEIEQMGRILAPYVKADACVGCGLCEYRCHSAWVGQQKLLPRSAVIVKARA